MLTSFRVTLLACALIFLAFDVLRPQPLNQSDYAPSQTSKGLPGAFDGRVNKDINRAASKVRPPFARHAALMCGAIRSLRWSVPTLLDNMEPSGDIDLYAVLSSDSANATDSLNEDEKLGLAKLSQFPNLKGVLLLLTPDDDLIPEERFFVPGFDYDENPEYVRPGPPLMRRLRNVHQFFKFLVAWELMEQATHPYRHAYKSVIRIRPEIKILTPNAINLDVAVSGAHNLSAVFFCRPPNAMGTQTSSYALWPSPNAMVHPFYLPSCCHHGGFNDQLFWGPYNVMRHAMNTIQSIQRIMEMHTHGDWIPFHPESLLRWGMVDQIFLQEDQYDRKKHPHPADIEHCIKAHRVRVDYALVRSASEENADSESTGAFFTTGSPPSAPHVGWP